MLDAWGEVQNALVLDRSGDVLKGSLEHLLEAKKELGLRRVTPLAEALTEASIGRPGANGDLLLETAKRLDPELPSARFMMGRRAWENGRRVQALGEIANGIFNMFRAASLRRAVLMSMVPWVLLAIGISLAAAILIQVGVFFRLVSVDAYLFGLRLFNRMNALVFSAVVVTLPIFAGLGPIWLLIYLFSMVWIYMRMRQRVTAVFSLVLILLFVPALQYWRSVGLHSEPLDQRIVGILQERQADFVSLREFMELEPDLGDSATFHVIAGELLRLHGDRELGRLQFEKAIVVSPNAVLPRLFLGAYALEDRDPWRALELLNEAVDMDSGSALAHYNLAIALDLTRRFDEGDSERATARELAGGNLKRLGLPGQEERVLIPRLGSGIVRNLVREAPETVRRALEGTDNRRHFFNGFSVPPLSITALMGLLVGSGMVFVRRKWYPPARECDKCGKVFRPDDRSAYCEQCVSVFLRRNAVSIEQQTAKVAQVRRWDLVTGLVSRVAGAIVPGGRQVIEGRVGLGILLTFLTWLPVLGAMMWAPLFLQEIEPAFPVVPLQIGMGFLGFGTWAVIAVSGWGRR